LLSEGGLFASLPMLVYYNFIFILPMILITLIVYFGYSKVEQISGWKEKNIKLLHLIAGILVFGIGLAIYLAGFKLFYASLVKSFKH
jgi:ascorbate-specific PTS system EIIC-type component UlaA